MGGCMGQWVGSGQMTNLIKLELINIIWFCLKIYNLWRHPYLWVDGWVYGWAHVKPLKSNKYWPNRDNSIMDIFDILLDILLKPPQPFIGLFYRKKLNFFDSQLYQSIYVVFGSSKHCNPFRRPPVHFRSLRQDRRDLLSSLTGTLFHDPRKRTKRGKKHEYFNFAVQRD